ncbi:hypothetical protein Agub_g591 [Astrephomene gubernaculifera]|uniref:Uncharacterized protein n=1 Tax=Astrephomene gubernaculifera TaxID=47775 RepID=A0AAD3HGR6_9CHLO|nr:hypothetical protein Agub_g591 [Astrephomene gubernaculifera]
MSKGKTWKGYLPQQHCSDILYNMMPSGAALSSGSFVFRSLAAALLILAPFMTVEGSLAVDDPRSSPPDAFPPDYQPPMEGAVSAREGLLGPELFLPPWWPEARHPSPIVPDFGHSVAPPPVRPTPAGPAASPYGGYYGESPAPPQYGSEGSAFLAASAAPSYGGYYGGSPAPPHYGAARRALVETTAAAPSYGGYYGSSPAPPPYGDSDSAAPRSTRRQLRG